MAWFLIFYRLPEAKALVFLIHDLEVAMKRIAVVAFVLLVGSVSSALSFSVNLLESNYSYDIFQNVHYPESEVASDRISGITRQPFYKELSIDVLGGSVSAEPFSLLATSSGSTRYSSLHGSGYAFVSGTWLFKLAEIENELVIQGIIADAWIGSYAILNDLTDNHEIFNNTFIFNLGPYVETYLADV